MNERIITGIDIGTSKVCTVIAELAKDGVLDIIGEGSAPSEGVRRGSIVNLEKATLAIQSSLRAAERVAGIPFPGRALVGVNGSYAKSFLVHGAKELEHDFVEAQDLEAVVESAQSSGLSAEYQFLHSSVVSYELDGKTDIKDPTGMAGSRLGAQVFLAGSPQGELANLRQAVEAAGVYPESWVLASYASALATLNSDELAQNVLLLDIGAGISQGIVLQQGRPIYSTTVPLGGSLISSDIAQILKIPFEEAERVKKKYGAALPELADPDLALEVSSDSGAAGTLPASELARYIRPRVLEILGHCQQAFQPTLDEQRITLDQVVLTGGATLLKGSEELAQRLLGLPVRIGRPQGISGLTQEVSSPAHATVVGLVRYAAIKGAGAASESRVVEPVPVSWWGRIRNSFKNFF